MRPFLKLCLLCQIISCFIVFDFALAETDNPFDLPPEAFSAAHERGGFSMLVNPAYSAFKNSPNFSYRYSAFDESDDGNHYFMTNFWGFSFAWMWYEEVLDQAAEELQSSKAKYYYFSKGISLRDVLAIGVGYSSSKSNVQGFDDFSGWHLGILLRPCEFLSFGYSRLDMWSELEGESVRYRDIYSLGIRPFTDRLTFTVDGLRRRGEKFKDIDYSFSAEARLFYDISVFARSDFSDTITVGCTIPLFFRSSGNAYSTDVYRTFDQKPHDNTSIGLSVQGQKNENALPSALRSENGNNILVLKLDRQIQENEVASFFKPRMPAFHDLLRGLSRASDDPGIDAVVLKIESARMGLAQLQELRNAVDILKKRGKKVYSFISNAGNKEYYLASACDSIYLAPNATLTITGLKADVYFFRGLMDKVGVKFESMKKGKYKSFDESFTREGMSDAFRANMNEILDDLNKQFFNDIAGSRGLSEKQLTDVLGRTIINPHEALSLGLVDKILYEQESMEDIHKDPVIINMSEYIKESPVDHRWGGSPVIALVHVSGSIVQGRVSGRTISRNMGDETYSNILKQVFMDPFVQGVVIRIDSGGGSALASDRMWKSLVYLKNKYPKPVVFSFGNIAASGGYYIACTGDDILASKGSITGSIGVVSGKLSLREFYEKIGITKETIKKSDFADIFTESREWTEEERKRMSRSVDFIYDRFTGKVMEARKISSDNIENIAQGRVFSGSRARDRKLVDKYGGLMAAFASVCKKAEITGRYKIAVYPNEHTIDLDMLKSEELRIFEERISQLIDTARIMGYPEEQVIYMLPYRIEIH